MVSTVRKIRATAAKGKMKAVVSAIKQRAKAKTTKNHLENAFQYYIWKHATTTNIKSKSKFLQYVPDSLIQAEAGNKPFRPLRPPIHGLSKIFDE